MSRSRPDPKPDPAPEPEVRLVATGKVVQTAGGVFITIRRGVAPGEETFGVKRGHGALPNSVVWIYSDGSVTVDAPIPEPATITLPQRPADGTQQDHP